MSCAKCGLLNCACRTGKTRISAGGGSIDEVKGLAEAYLDRRGYSGDLLTVRRRRARIGVMGYQAWDLTYKVTKNG